MPSGLTNQFSQQPQLQKNTFLYKGQQVEMRDVYSDNLELEFVNIRNAIQKYNYVAMDTEFPGVVARPIGSFQARGDYQYQQLKCNADMLKVIQIGLTLCDEQGNFAPGCPCWQFNFHFNLQEDIYAQDSIELLNRSGLDFQAHRDRGIDPQHFAELLMTSGLVLCKDVKWVCFHGCFDFGYLLRLLTCKPLPAEEDEFRTQLRIFFPNIFDEKFMMTKCDQLHGGLNKLAQDLVVSRIGQMHQAGSDSMLTAQTFFKMKEVIFGGNLDRESFNGAIFGLNN